MDQGPQFEQHWYVSFVVKITPEFSGLKQHFSLSCSYSFFGSGISGGKLSQVVLDRGSSMRLQSMCWLGQRIWFQGGSPLAGSIGSRLVSVLHWTAWVSSQHGSTCLSSRQMIQARAIRKPPCGCHMLLVKSKSLSEACSKGRGFKLYVLKGGYQRIYILITTAVLYFSYLWVK